ncbi:MAG: D-2-hydroxyacid dehydrogenase [Burkholderiales bacterium]|nr:D-2-hydroxyacid dehydrogenase [Burkholderiales bacterium]
MPARLRVLIVDSPGKHPLYRITREQWRAACARHPAPARRVAARIVRDGPALAPALARAEAVIGVPARRDELCAGAPRLRWLHHTSAGVDGLVPLDWLPRGVAFTNNSGAHGAKAEEYLRMAYTMLNCRMPRIIADQHARRWRQVFSPGLAGQSALIVGLGDLGKAAARAARELGMTVTGVNRSGRRVPEADAVHPVARLDALLPRADYVVLATPLTAATRRIIDRRRLAHMKRGACLINIARAGVLDAAALSAALARGRLGGAMLDVVEPEPLPRSSPLWRTPNLVITPHVSCDDSERYSDITLDLWFANLERFLADRALKHRVDPRKGY